MTTRTPYIQGNLQRSKLCMTRVTQYLTQYSQQKQSHSHPAQRNKRRSIRHKSEEYVNATSYTTELSNPTIYLEKTKTLIQTTRNNQKQDYPKNCQYRQGLLAVELNKDEVMVKRLWTLKENGSP